MIRTYIIRYYSRSSYVNKGDSLLSLLTAVVLVFFLAMTTHLADFGQRRKVKMVTLKTYRLEMLPLRPPRQSEEVAPRPVVQRPLATQAQPKPRPTFRQPKQVVRSQAVAVQPKVIVSERSVSRPVVYRPSRSLASITGPPGPVEEIRREFPKRPPIDFGESARKIPDFTRGGGSGGPIGRPDIALPGRGIGRGPEGKGGYGRLGAFGEGGPGTGGAGGGSGGGAGQGIGRGRGSSGPWSDPIGGRVPGPDAVRGRRLLLRLDSPSSLADQLGNLALISRRYGARAVEVTFDGFKLIVKHRPAGSLEYLELFGDEATLARHQKEDLIRQGIRQIIANWPQ